jgi:glucokinase
MTQDGSSLILAFDVGGTRIKAGLVQHGKVLTTLIVPTQSEDLVETLLQIGHTWMMKHAVTGLGLSIKGIVNPVEGVVREVNETLQAIQGLPLADVLAKELNIAVVMENDARMYTWGEFIYGAGRGYQNLLCLTLGTGVGCGVILNRHLLRGEHGTGGILGGHIIIQSDGERCTCGNHGCLERYVGGIGWVQQIKRILPKQSALAQEAFLDPARLFAAAAMGDRIAEEAVQQWVLHLATGIITLIHVYDPDVVVIGGGLAHAAGQFLPAVQAYVNDHAWTLPRARVAMVAAQCGDVAALLGVAELAQEAIAFL